MVKKKVLSFETYTKNNYRRNDMVSEVSFKKRWVYENIDDRKMAVCPQLLKLEEWVGGAGSTLSTLKYL